MNKTTLADEEFINTTAYQEADTEGAAPNGTAQTDSPRPYEKPQIQDQYRHDRHSQHNGARD
jgi:hypothetical protein